MAAKAHAIVSRKVADLANTRIYELQNAIKFRNPQDDADDA